jgi:hypothetical protein
LLSSDDVARLVNHPGGGIAIHWRCPCGAEGVHETGRRSHAGPAIRAPKLELVR